MSTKVWAGGSISTPQQNTVTPASVAIGNVFNVVTNGKQVSFVATATTVANVTAGLAAAIAASTEPEWQELTAVDNTTNVLITGPATGAPFTQTSSATGGTATLTTATATAPISPNAWDVAGNWSPSGVPVASDDVIIDNTDVSILYGLDQHTITLTTLFIGAGFTGTIGLASRNLLGYSEYRDQYCRISATSTISVGSGIGSGSGRIKLDTGSVKATLNVLKTGPPAETGLEALLWKGTNATSIISIIGGSVGIAVLPGEVATVPNLGVGGGAGNQAPSVRCGPGVTLTTLTQFGGTVVLNAGLTTVNKFDGTLTVYGGGAVTTVNNDGGLFVWNSDGTITTLNVSEGGKADLTGDPRAKTVTDCTLQAGATLAFEVKTVTFTNPIVLNRCSLADISLMTGTHCRLAVTVGP